MPTFTFPIPTEVLDCTAIDWRQAPKFSRLSVPDAPTSVIESVQAAWGGREFIPAAAFVMHVRFPISDDPKRYEVAWGGIALYVTRTLLRAGVLESGPSSFSGSFGAGESSEPEVVVTMTQLCWPDGTPAVLPRQETSCAPC